MSLNIDFAGIFHSIILEPDETQITTRPQGRFHTDIFLPSHYVSLTLSPSVNLQTGSIGERLMKGTSNETQRVERRMLSIKRKTHF